MSLGTHGRLTTEPGAHGQTDRCFRGPTLHSAPAGAIPGVPTAGVYALCWSGDDHPCPLIERAASWLVVNKVLPPGVSVLERFVGRIRDRTQ